MKKGDTRKKTGKESPQFWRDESPICRVPPNLHYFPEEMGGNTFYAKQSEKKANGKSFSTRFSSN